jgi:LacI family transcriptional regulator
MMTERVYQNKKTDGERKSGRPTIHDLARAAGVSVATVDRVINGRLPVRPPTALLVRKAAQSIGFHACTVIDRRLITDRMQVRLGFILQRSTNPFYRGLSDALEAAARGSTTMEVRPVIEYLDDLAPAFVADRLRRMGEQVDVVAVVAADHPYVSRAISDLHDRGRPVVALLSDLSAPMRAGYVGVDWRKTGRTAGWSMPKLTRGRGKVAIVLGSHRYQGHELCEISFRSYLREYAPDLVLLEPLISLEDPRLAYESTLDLLKRTPDLVGIYVAGGGVEGVIQALREVALDRKIAAICHELTDDTREGLIDGVVALVMSHPLALLASATVHVMEAAAQGAAAPLAGGAVNEASDSGSAMGKSAALTFVRMEIYTPENL